MAFRFVHTADLHLDSPLRSLALRDVEVAALVETATRHCFSNIVRLCLDERVDALLIAGDLYDGELRSAKTAAFLLGELRKLSEAGIRTFIVWGNHDAESGLTRLETFPDAVHVFSGRGEAVEVPDTDAVVHGVSFAERQAPDSLLPKYKAPVDGRINVALMHTSLAGSSAHDPYAPCSVADLAAAGFDYWALGHIHKREMHASGPHAIVMPGTPQGRHVNEAGVKSVSLVTVSEKGVEIEERFPAIAQFERVAVDLGGVTERSEAVDKIAADLARARQGLRAEHLIARVELAGTTPLAGILRRDHDVLRTDLLNIAAGLGRTLIEDLRIDLRQGTGAAEDADGTPLAELRRLVGAERAEAGLMEAGMDVVRALQDALPPDLRDGFGADEDGLRATVERALAGGTEEVLARLEGSHVRGDDG